MDVVFYSLRKKRKYQIDKVRQTYTTTDCNFWEYYERAHADFKKTGEFKWELVNVDILRSYVKGSFVVCVPMGLGRFCVFPIIYLDSLSICIRYKSFFIRFDVFSTIVLFIPIVIQHIFDIYRYFFYRLSISLHFLII